MAQKYHNDIAGGIGELGFFDNIEFVLLSELEDITGGIRELDFFDNIEFVWIVDVSQSNRSRVV